MNANFSVLIADDNQYMRSIIGTILRSCGVRKIEEAANGAEALEKLQTGHFDAAIVDIRMDPIDGIEFTQMVRTSRDSPNPYLPIIILSAFSERRRITEARDAGIDEFLVKPVSARALIERLRAVIEAQRPFVRSSSYTGPDRRRRSSKSYTGPQRRADDAALAVDDFDSV